MPQNVRSFAGFTSSAAFRSSAISIVRLRSFRITPPQPGWYSFPSCCCRDCGCGKAMCSDDLFRKDRPDKSFKPTPEAAITPTSGPAYSVAWRTQQDYSHQAGPEFEAQRSNECIGTHRSNRGARSDRASIIHPTRIACAPDVRKFFGIRQTCNFHVDPTLHSS